MRRLLPAISAQQLLHRGPGARSALREFSADNLAECDGLPFLLLPALQYFGVGIIIVSAHLARQPNDLITLVFIQPASSMSGASPGRPDGAVFFGHSNLNPSSSSDQR